MTTATEKQLDVAAKAYRLVERQRLRQAILHLEVDHFGVLLIKKLGKQVVDDLVKSIRADLDKAQDTNADVVTCPDCNVKIRLPLNSKAVQCPKCKTRLQ